MLFRSAEVRKVARKRKVENKKKDKLENLKWEVADELELDDDLAQGGDELTVREAGKIGGNMVKKLVAKGKEAIAEEERNKQR